jgi:uncharacterized membrane protein YsdA (DUF1294 family)
MNLLFCYFFSLNAIGFLLTAYDKHLAKAQKKRISERTLLGCVFFGGTIGSGLAMFVFRHKTSKTSYLYKYWGIVMLHILMIYLWFKYGYFKI